MSERNSDISTSSVICFLLMLLLIVTVTIFISSYVRDLQRRVGQLEKVVKQ